MLFLVIAVTPSLLAVEPVSVFLAVFGGLGGVGGLLGGYAAIQANKGSTKAVESKHQVDIVVATHEAMASHMETLRADAEATRKDLHLVRQELARVNQQLAKCQDDKLDMQRQNEEWRRRWEEQHGTSPDS